MQNNQEMRLAVLIDADNVPSANLKEMMEEIAKYGTPTFKRIYGDWTKPTVARWKNLLLENAITPIQQYSYTQGKNATDSAMIIDAMDILYTGRVEGFCIISSDSDFTRLALRLREAGMKVIGMGQNKTPSPFIAACDKFIYIEILKPADTLPAKEEDVKQEEAPEPVSIKKVDRKLISLIASSVNDLADESGWAYLGELGNLVLKKQPDFDARNYGFKKLVMLVKSTGAFEIDERLTEKGNGNVKHVFVKNKPAKTQKFNKRPKAPQNTGGEG
ncbi:NYN domain-containing protein [Foetidibacter luteolus]|uniref:NYN domain-containing protein n=1 Tax=Foetidibacter luteolus TaxID=2608880 RepID=UPI00129A37EB|nr:NYN domain-containing protein [Foetidibacter luteolus]